MGNQQHVKWLFEGAEDWNARRKNDGFKPDFSTVDLYFACKLEGKLDIDGNIPLSDFHLSGSNFRESRLCQWTDTGAADLRNAQLWATDFRDCYLTNAKLDGARIVGGQLQRANLSSASLRGAKLMSANLDGTDLSQADLSGADLQLAYLGKSSLSYANLSNADLTTAILVGADLSCSQPWTARLFPKSKDLSNLSSGGLGKQIRGIGDLTEAVAKLRSKNDFDGEIYFRGEAKRPGN